MSFTTLKSLLDQHRAVHVQTEGKPSVSRYKHVQHFATCPQHGQYPLNMIDENGVERWFPSGCPVCNKQEKVAKLFADSNIPVRFIDCTFDNYVVSSPQQQRVVDRCKGYASEFSQYRKSGGCLLLCGRPGTGKNHLATAVIREVLAAGYTALRIKASQYLDSYWAKTFAEREPWLQGMANIDLMIIDELGRSSNAKAAQDAMFRLIDARYEAQLPNLITTNLNREGLIDVLGEAAYDRIAQGGSFILTLNWDSYRAGGARMKG